MFFMFSEKYSRREARERRHPAMIYNGSEPPPPCERTCPNHKQESLLKKLLGFLQRQAVIIPQE